MINGKYDFYKGMIQAVIRILSMKTQDQKVDLNNLEEKEKFLTDNLSDTIAHHDIWPQTDLDMAHIIISKPSLLSEEVEDSEIDIFVEELGDFDTDNDCHLILSHTLARSINMAVCEHYGMIFDDGTPMYL